MYFCTGCGIRVTGTHGEAGQEERRTVSVLVLDLVAPLSTGGQLDPEDVRRLQADYFATAGAVIRRYGGLVEKYAGDAVTAVFGVPVETEHDASRAVLTGLALHHELTARPHAGHDPVSVRVGIATGEVLVDLGSRDTGHGLVSGDVVAAAARAQQLAPPGAVLVTPVTRRASLDAVRYQQTPLELTTAASKAPARLWRAVGPVAPPDREDQELTAFVGREHELDLLAGGLRRSARDNQPGLISVVGEHGLGKSRLVRELRRHRTDVAARWCVGRCLPYREGSAYAALAEIVKSYVGILDSDPPELARQRLQDTVRTLMPGERVDRITDLLGPLVGLPGTPTGAAEARAAWRDLVLAMARREPVVIVVEDLHYAEPGMLDFLAHLVETAENVPLFLLCTARPELFTEYAGWATVLPATMTVSLRPLRPRELTPLVESLLARHQLPSDLAGRLVAITAGNPMYAVEYIRMLAEQLSGNGSDDVELVAPEPVQGVLAHRIDLLGRTERRVLHAAAVLGERVWPSAIAAVLSLDQATASAALTALCRRGMLVESTSSVARETELVFRHQLLRDAAYRRLPRSTRSELHSRAADWLGRLANGRHDLATAVARHRLAALELAESLGEDTATTVRQARWALIQAAHAAYAVHAVEVALGHIAQALTLWPVGEEPAARRGAELLRHRLAYTADADEFYRQGGPKELLRLAELMREHGDAAGEAQAAALLAVAEAMRAERGRATEHLTRAVTLFADLPDSLPSAEAYGELGRLHMMEFRFPEAIEAARTSWQIAARLGAPDQEMSSRITEAMARYLSGDGDAVPELESILATCREQQLPALRRAAYNLAVVYTEEGELARAKRAQEEGDGYARGRRHWVVSHSEEALLAYFTGDWTLLLQAAEVYLDTANAETSEWDLHLRAQRAWIRVLCAEPAGEDVTRCLDTAERSGFANLWLTATAHGALCRAIEGDPPTALRLLEQFAEAWRVSATTMTQEWLPAAAHAAAVLAPDHPQAAATVRRATAVAVRRTPWVVASEHTARGAAAMGRGEVAAAAGHFADAVAAYDAIGSASDAALTAAWTVRAYLAAGDEVAAGPYLERVRGFADRCRAPRLTQMACGSRPPGDG